MYLVKLHEDHSMNITYIHVFVKWLINLKKFINNWKAKNLCKTKTSNIIFFSAQNILIYLSAHFTLVKKTIPVKSDLPWRPLSCSPRHPGCPRSLSPEQGWSEWSPFSQILPVWPDQSLHLAPLSRSPGPDRNILTVTFIFKTSKQKNIYVLYIWDMI